MSRRSSQPSPVAFVAAAAHDALDAFIIYHANLVFGPHPSFIAKERKGQAESANTT